MSGSLSEFPVIFDSPAFVVINKPAGVSVHKDQSDLGLVTQLEQQLSTSLFLVHRLDKETSGLLVLAKTSEVAAQFGRLFESKLIEKHYIALSDQKPKKKQGWVKGDLLKARRGAWKLSKTQENPAITYFESCLVVPGVRLYAVQPKTGKTHQIRVALKSVGAPIMGDRYYGGSSADRLYLHAWRLSFTLSDQFFEFEAWPQSGDGFRSALEQDTVNTFLRSTMKQ
jgi:tRNA pseudouridine32 synthase/23S rRNA pseudouridine746 synthase